MRTGLGLPLALADLPGRRRAGSFGWAGLSNCYGWVDPASGLSGLIMMQFHPFADPAALALLERFERALYDAE
ncbi:hypothetical protein IAI58_03805 [Roseomonas marmotae]|uniref:Beta-lactamase-related domain-containing protein n=1 Tax=Roseomonas marmotae TaxID=2768161 RepID=A0ABS3KC72_9PROT|nr:hypothetical protein [Roseomonas marmotae]MBO1075049.1 hypothetical protein [Roseomonas marmotae]QTI80809.1 hypothetical protein IAI58_03805 [Roseomonas marmotae]